MGLIVGPILLFLGVAALAAMLIGARWLSERLTLRTVPAAEETPLCSACGYDLRGTLAAGRDRCPECGVETDRTQM